MDNVDYQRVTDISGVEGEKTVGIWVDSGVILAIVESVILNHNQPKHIMKYAIINTMNALDNYAGSLVSRHHTRAAAEQADETLQRLTRRWCANGYLPTMIAEVTAATPRNRGSMVHESHIVDGD